MWHYKKPTALRLSEGSAKIYRDKDPIKDDAKPWARPMSAMVLLSYKGSSQHFSRNAKEINETFVSFGFVVVVVVV